MKPDSARADILTHAPARILPYGATKDKSIKPRNMQSFFMPKKKLNPQQLNQEKALQEQEYLKMIFFIFTPII